MPQDILYEINRVLPHGEITIGDVISMKQVIKSSDARSYNVYAIQYRDLTILVRVFENNTFSIKLVMW